MFNFEIPVLMVDLETTGLDKNDNGILQIGMVVIHKDGSFTDEFSVDVKLEKPWGNKVNDEALKVNHINLVEHNKVGMSNKAAQKLVDSYLQNLKGIYGRKLAISGHNIIQFDLPWLENWMNFARSSLPEKGGTWFDVYFGWLSPILDTKQLFTAVKDYKEFGLNSLKKDDILVWYGIDNVRHGNLHQALPDAKYEGELLHMMFKTGLLSTTQSLLEISPQKMNVYKRSAKMLKEMKKLMDEIDGIPEL